MRRGLIADFYDYPATMGLCSLWVLVFAMMALTAYGEGRLDSASQLLLSLNAGHRFGDMTLDDIRRGEVWRALTSTFVHFGVAHLGMNLYGMYQLGCLVESWYGPAQLVAIYVVMGGGGNLLSAAIRTALGSDPRIHSGGGSTVILGLVALCAVVGWRSRTRIGEYLRNQMIGVLAFTAVLGQFLSVIDNWGHAAGAIVGGFVGLGHRVLIRSAHRPVGRWAGGVAAALIALSGAAQLRDDRAEGAALRRWQAADATSLALETARDVYSTAYARENFQKTTFVPAFLLDAYPRPTHRGSPGTPSILDMSEERLQAELDRAIRRLETRRNTLGRGPTASDFEGAIALLAKARSVPPSGSEVEEFSRHLNALFGRVKPEQGEAWARLQALGAPAPVRKAPSPAPAYPILWQDRESFQPREWHRGERAPTTTGARDRPG